ncbi:MAG: TonB-dependent receptor [Pseudobacteriovorax sp.]|nr:TonB-dependent receptor [Pseudobacteriovorax sp.]
MKRFVSKFVFCFGPLWAATGALAVETITVVGEKISIGTQLGPSTYVIDSEDISRRNLPSVVDYLSQVPGIFVQRTGGPGAQASVFIRGAKQDEVVIAINGMAMSDPTLTGAGFDLSHISVANIERIEVFRGAQSVKFGSNALGGVINIVTKQGVEDSRLRIEVGTSEQRRLGLETSGGDEALSYRLNAEGYEIKSISSAAEDAGNKETDPYERLLASGEVRASGDKWFSSLYVQARDTNKSLDAFGDIGALIDDPNYENRTKQRNARGLFGLDLGPVELLLEASHNSIRREYEDETDPGFTGNLTSAYDGKQDIVGLSMRVPLAEDHSLSIVTEGKKDYAETRSSFGGISETDDNRSYAASYEWNREQDFGLSLGARRDFFERVGDADTGTFRVHQNFSMGTLYFQANKGFKAPSLFQTFDPTYGNKDLKPEESESLELGYKLDRGIAFVNVSVFQNEFENLIIYDFGSNTYLNVDGLTTTRGGELSFGHIWRLHRVELSTSYLDMTKNDKPLARRPQNTYGLSYQFDGGSWSAGSDTLWVGKRSDFSGYLEPYSVTDVYANYKFSSYKLYARVDNLLNKRYREVSGYSRARREAVVGTEVFF